MILSDKNYECFKRMISDAIDMAYMEGVNKVYGDSIKNNQAFKKYRSNLASWCLDNYGIVSKTREHAEKKLNGLWEEAFKQ